ncbi:MAG: PilZ domain-containing protein [Terracidiphilus sp.]
MATGTLQQHQVAGYSPGAGGNMELRKHCAYNQTRECFLGLEVATADIPYASLNDLMPTLALKSGEGLWLEPFRGIPETGMRTPLDLVYLDEDCRVIDVVESFPTFRVTPSSPRASSVLVLPTHSIYSSQTQGGDQLVLCMAEEMERRLAQFSATGSAAAAVQSAVLLREKPLWSGGPGVLQLEDRSTEARPGSQQTHEMELIQPGTKNVRPPRNWLERWWSPDPRKAPREPAPGLAAYYWTGGNPEARSIRDISSTGLYLVTEERWYPGTLVLMTLQQTDGGEECVERSISVHTRAVRWGNDGVGLQFIVSDGPHQGRGADRKELERFLQQLGKDKR